MGGSRKEGKEKSESMREREKERKMYNYIICELSQKLTESEWRSIGSI